MPRFIPVASVTQIPPGRAEAFVVGSYEIAVFNVGGTFYAIENACPHQGGPLSEGFIDGPVVTCPWHAWCFNVADGHMTLGGFTSVETFEVLLEGETISVASEPRC
jgi:nitrite reductase (NADH) small subunit/3-phenylpropionate/trans-cinnamate dioxygenase ferredoxin subunit